MTDATNGEALRRFRENDGDSERDPLERLRMFCSLAMNGDDWIDSEPFFDAVEAAITPPTASAGMVVVPRERLQTALARAKVFDDGADGADAESARSVAAILSSMLAAHESQSPNRQVREDSQGLGEPGRLPPYDPTPAMCMAGTSATVPSAVWRAMYDAWLASESMQSQLESPPADTTPDVSERGQEWPCPDCKPFCEMHGRDEIATDDNGDEFCCECAADGFSGDLCNPSCDSCDMLSDAANSFERSFMCERCASKHVVFCAEPTDNVEGE